MRRGRPRAYTRELSAKAAYNCEHALEQRCRCRCRGRHHGRGFNREELAELGPADPHFPGLWYCPGDCNCSMHAALRAGVEKAKAVDKLF